MCNVGSKEHRRAAIDKSTKLIVGKEMVSPSHLQVDLHSNIGKVLRVAVGIMKPKIPILHLTEYNADRVNSSNNVSSSFDSVVRYSVGIREDAKDQIRFIFRDSHLLEEIFDLCGDGLVSRSVDPQPIKCGWHSYPTISTLRAKLCG